jgi:hypothetical protein
MVRLILLFLSLISGFGGSSHAQVLPPEARFVMSHFKADGGGGDERLYVSWSPDGVNWTCLNGGLPVWQPPGWQGFWNVVRDPSIIHANGYYWVAYTCGNYGKGNTFGLVKSTDLLNWSFVASVDVTLPGATDQLTWNPVLFEDGDGLIHATIAISPVGGSQYNCVPYMRVHEIHPVNPDWTQWSTPVPLDLPDTNTNEGWIWKEGDTYHITYVSFVRAGQIVHATSKNLVTGWAVDKVLGYGAQEGGMILPKPNGGYRLYLEPGNGDGTATDIGYRTCDFDGSLSNPTPQVGVNATVPMRNGKMCAARGTMTFSQWQSSQLSTVPIERRSLLADADEDGLSNLAEYSMGTDPLTHTEASRRPRPYLRSTGSMQFPGLVFKTLRSTVDVNAQAEIKIGENSWSPNGLIESVSLLSDGTVRYHLRSTSTLGETPVFLRYTATLNSPLPILESYTVQSTASSDSRRLPRSGAQTLTISTAKKPEGKRARLSTRLESDRFRLLRSR